MSNRDNLKRYVHWTIQPDGNRIQMIGVQYVNHWDAIRANQHVAQSSTTRICTRNRDLLMETKILQAQAELQARLRREEIKRILSARVEAYFDAVIRVLNSDIRTMHKVRYAIQYRDAWLSRIRYRPDMLRFGDFPALSFSEKFSNNLLINELAPPIETRYTGSIRCSTQAMIEQRMAMAMRDPFQRQAATCPALRAVAVGGVVVTGVVVAPVVYGAGKKTIGQAITRYTPTAINAIGRVVPYYNSAVLQLQGVGTVTKWGIYGGFGLGAVDGVVRALTDAPPDTPHFFPFLPYRVGSDIFNIGTTILREHYRSNSNDTER